MGLTAILALVTAGMGIADEFIDDDSKAGGWVKLGQLAAKGITGAIAAIDQLQSWQASGYNPSNDELDAMLAENVRKSAIIQGHQPG